MQITANNLTVREENLKSYRILWRKTIDDLQWGCLCMLPHWVETWWEMFGSHADMHICSFRSKDAVVGIAPLQIDGKTAKLIGDPDVCDYLDFIARPQASQLFFDALFRYLRRRSVSDLDLRAQRPDSVFMSAFNKNPGALDCKAMFEVEDETYEMQLPENWDAYLTSLRGKDRHEIRRKNRRLNEAGEVSTRIFAEVNEIEQVMPVFMELFADNRSDKASFMTDRMTGYFLQLAKAASKEGFIKLHLLEVDKNPAAAVMLFDYNGVRHLYNNGYAKRYKALSVGHLSKVYSIRDGIKSGMKRYDFLKGGEPYKRRLGGKAAPIYRCRIRI